MKLIDQIEAYRKARGLRPTDMAAIFKVPDQNYNNWVYRKSVPKDYIEKAMLLLADPKPAKNVGDKIKIQDGLPLISYVQAGQWNEAIDLYHPGYAESFVPTTQSHSGRAFALRVEGYSMTLPQGVDGRSFPPGIIIMVDPERESNVGDFVVARYNGNEVTFKKLSSEEGRPVLVPLNPNRNEYPIMRVEFEIIGRVFDASYGGF